MKWQPIKTAPKNKTIIIIKSVSGIDKSHILFTGPANWRSEYKEALFDPITKKCFCPSGYITGWMRVDVPYRVPGIPLCWKHINP